MTQQNTVTTTKIIFIDRGRLRNFSSSNPHALPIGFFYYTLCPFEAMSAASALGLRVGRYATQGFGHSVEDPNSLNYFGYSVYGTEGAVAINYEKREFCQC